VSEYDDNQERAQQEIREDIRRIRVAILGDEEFGYGGGMQGEIRALDERTIEIVVRVERLEGDSATAKAFSRGRIAALTATAAALGAVVAEALRAL
jgi:hypothetical protein